MRDLLRLSLQRHFEGFPLSELLETAFTMG